MISRKFSLLILITGLLTSPFIRADVSQSEIPNDVATSATPVASPSTTIPSSLGGPDQVSIPVTVEFLSDEEAAKLGNAALQPDANGILSISTAKPAGTEEASLSAHPPGGGSSHAHSCNMQGKASVYGESMEGKKDGFNNKRAADGEVFNTNALTIACNSCGLKRNVRITDPATGKSVVARVTDTGGFGKLGRIADLSHAVAVALHGSDLNEVHIQCL